MNLYLGESHVALNLGKFSYYNKATLTKTVLNGAALSGVTLYYIKNILMYHSLLIETSGSNIKKLIFIIDNCFPIVSSSLQTCRKFVIFYIFLILLQMPRPLRFIQNSITATCKITAAHPIKARSTPAAFRTGHCHGYQTKDLPVSAGHSALQPPRQSTDADVAHCDEDNFNYYNCFAISTTIDK